MILKRVSLVAGAFIKSCTILYTSSVPNILANIFVGLKYWGPKKGHEESSGFLKTTESVLLHYGKGYKFSLLKKSQHKSSHNALLCLLKEF